MKNPESARNVDYERDDLAIYLHSTDDAYVWATEFMRLVKQGVKVDFDLMITWFANAMEVAKMHAHSDGQEVT